MGLRCSLLGHVHGEPTTEREREEQGGEVVVVERDLQVCDRCGHEKVLSENTEVRSLEATPGQDESTAGDADAADAVDAPVAESTDSTAASGGPRVGTPSEHAPPAGEDDAVILEDEPERDRDPGQWPDEAQQETLAEATDVDPGADHTDADDTDAADSEPAPWPDQEGEDEGFDARPASETDAGGEFEFGGLTPESAAPGEAGDEGYVEAPAARAEPVTASAHADNESADHGFTSAGPVNPPSGSTDDADTVLVCPECGFERAAARASLRAGDICPECRRGYLAEQR